MTEGVDETIKLIADKLPGWTWILDSRDLDGKGARARLLPPGQISTSAPAVYGITPAAALKTAVAEALAGESE